MMEHDDEPTQMRYAQAIADWGDAGGYEQETVWDECHHGLAGRALRPGAVPQRIAPCPAANRSAWCWKHSSPAGRTAAAGRAGQLPGRSRQALAGGEAARVAQIGAVRQPRPRAAGQRGHPDRHPGAGRPVPRRGSTAAASKATCRPATTGNARFEELRKRWDEEHAKLKELVNMYKNKAAFRSGHGQPLPCRAHPAAASSSRPVRPRPCRIDRTCRCGSRAAAPPNGRWCASKLELTGLMKPFSTEIWFGDRVGAARVQRLRQVPLPAPAGRRRHRPGEGTPAGPEVQIAEVPHTGTVKLGARIRPGFFAQTHVRPDLRASRWWTSCTAATTTAPAWAARPRPQCWTATAWPGRRSSSMTRSPAANRRGCRSCCWSSPAPPCCCSTSPPTTLPALRRSAGAGH